MARKVTVILEPPERRRRDDDVRSPQSPKPFDVFDRLMRICRRPPVAPPVLEKREPGATRHLRRPSQVLVVDEDEGRLGTEGLLDLSMAERIGETRLHPTPPEARSRHPPVASCQRRSPVPVCVRHELSPVAP